MDAQIRPGVKASAHAKGARLAKVAPAPVLFARVTLDHAADPAVARPAIAQVLLDLGGRPVGAQVSARVLEEAVDLLEAWLRHRWSSSPAGGGPCTGPRAWPSPGSGTTATCRPSRPTGSPPARPAAGPAARDIRPPALSAEKAAGELVLLDDDVHLFAEASTSKDAGAVATSRRDLRPVGGRPRGAGPGRLHDPGRAAAAPTARTEHQAIELLDLSGRRFVFFVDTGTGRGTVVDRRLDGHDGLLTPAA